jgi:hypothetical protein
LYGTIRFLEGIVEPSVLKCGRQLKYTHEEDLDHIDHIDPLENGSLQRNIPRTQELSDMTSDMKP